MVTAEGHYNNIVTTEPIRNLGQPEWLGVTRDLWLTAAILITSTITGQVFIDCVRSRNTPNAPVEVGVAAARAGHVANLALHG